MHLDEKLSDITLVGFISNKSSIEDTSCALHLFIQRKKKCILKIRVKPILAFLRLEQLLNLYPSFLMKTKAEKRRKKKEAFLFFSPISF